MATISGVWVFKDVSSAEYAGFADVTVNFTSNGEDFVGMEAYAQPIHYIKSDGSSVAALCADSTWYWVEAYRTVDFGESEQEVSDDFYTWFTTNATQGSTDNDTETDTDTTDTVYRVMGSTLTAICDKIRELTGTTSKISLADIPTLLETIANTTEEV